MHFNTSRKMHFNTSSPQNILLSSFAWGFSVKEGGNNIVELGLVAGLFQFRAIQGVQGLRCKLADPTPELPPSPLWITLHGTTHHEKRHKTCVTSQVGAPCRTSQKRKQTEEHDELIIDVDTWLQEARQANDEGALHCFTRTILHQPTATAPLRKKPRALNVLHICWAALLSCMKGLARRHLRTVATPERP